MVFEGNSVGTDFEANLFNSSNIGLFMYEDAQITYKLTKETFMLVSVELEQLMIMNNTITAFINNAQTNIIHLTYRSIGFDRSAKIRRLHVEVLVLNGPGDNIVSWVGEQYSKCLDSLFYGTKFSGLSTKAKWNLLFIMYRKHYLRDTTLLNNRDCLKSIIRYFKIPICTELSFIWCFGKS